MKQNFALVLRSSVRIYIAELRDFERGYFEIFINILSLIKLKIADFVRFWKGQHDSFEFLLVQSTTALL
jgi:hypothetical protein